MNESSAYVGLDVHKDTIAVAVALPGREEPVYRGEIKNQRKSLVRLIRSLSPHGEVLSFCYEAGPCGYGVYREIIETGHQCDVVAPSLIPRRAGERVKTDRRDALKLARLHRSGELVAVWVPSATMSVAAGAPKYTAWPWMRPSDFLVSGTVALAGWRGWR